MGLKLAEGGSMLVPNLPTSLLLTLEQEGS